MKSALKLLAVFLFTAILFFSSTQVFAQDVNKNQNTPQQNASALLNANSDVPIDISTITQGVIMGLMSNTSCILSGIDPLNPNGKCLGLDTKTGKIGYVEQNSGLIGISANLIGMTYNKPAGTKDYINYLSANFGIAKPAYAQGMGFNSLTPLINVWRAFRNLTYLLFVLVTIFIGLGIMLRFQIDPRTVMTIQNQIPKLIIGLLLVTFSFAIAGFLIDIMWVMIYLIFYFFGQIDPQINQELANLQAIPIAFVNSMAESGVGGGLINIPSIAANGIGDVFYNLIKSAMDSNLVIWWFFALLPPFTISTAICAIRGVVTGSESVRPCAEPFVTQGLGGLATGIFFIIILLALLIALFRLWFSLLKAYVFILVDVVFAPIWIMSGAFGTSGFSGWIRDLVANIAAFPVAIFLLLLGKVMMGSFRMDPGPGGYFLPPLIGNPSQPSVFAALIGLTLIMMSPSAVKMARDTLKVQPFPYIGAAGSALGAGQVVAGVGAGALWGRLTGPGQYDATGRELVPEGRLRRLALGDPSSGGKRGWRRRLAGVR